MKTGTVALLVEISIEADSYDSFRKKADKIIYSMEDKGWSVSEENEESSEFDEHE